MKLKHTLFLGIAAALLLGTTGLVQAGSTADDLKWPEIDSSYQKEGDFILPPIVRQVRAGVTTKDEVRLLLDNPQFSEGYFGVREWDYIFNFYTGGPDNAYITCQYKVLFDKNMVASSTHWKNPACEALVKEQKEKPHRLTLRSDGLFRFAKSDFANLLPEGQERLRQLAVQLKSAYSDDRLESVIVTGYTDRIGSNEDNMALSHARAATVKQYLVGQGIAADKITIEGKGEMNPVKVCAGAQSPQVIACLMPNRRIEIEVKGEASS